MFGKMKNKAYVCSKFLKMSTSKNINVTNHGFQAQEDSVLNLIEKSRMIKTDLVPSLKFMELTAFEKMARPDIGKWMKDTSNYSWGVLQSERDGMIKEFKSNQEKLHAAYTNPLETQQQFKGELSVKDLFNYIEYLKIRLLRSMCYMNPEFTFTNAKSPSTRVKYELIKAYWIEDDGTKSRSFNKSVGIEGTTLEELNVKLFEGFDYLPKLDQAVNGTKVDLIISKGGKKWVVELKDQDKQNFIDSFVSMEMWKHYKKTYDR